ncbi:MAG: hypothetical protein QME71_10315 [Dehalococcoidia bacterium]|nr:hypothetical protein [Dehalococcoidia bacterium]
MAMEEQDLFVRETDQRVFATNADEPEEGRVFVWSLARWYERLEGELGGVVFSPITDSEEELRAMLNAEGLDMTELDDEFARDVREEFREQDILYPAAPEDSDEPPGEQEPP